MAGRLNRVLPKRAPKSLSRSQLAPRRPKRARGEVQSRSDVGKQQSKVSGTVNSISEADGKPDHAENHPDEDANGRGSEGEKQSIDKGASSTGSSARDGSQNARPVVRQATSISGAYRHQPVSSTFRVAYYKGPLAGRKCLITGATSGIGYAIARRFVEEGAASVVNVSRHHEKIDRAYKRMQRELRMKNPPLYSIRGDVTDKAFCETKIFENRHLKDLDVLVNAAGISQASVLADTSWETIQQIINTNLSATITMSNFFQRKAVQRYQSRTQRDRNRGQGGPGQGGPDVSVVDDPAIADFAGLRSRGALWGPSPCIINISSLLGLKGGFAATAYAASKAGVLGFTRALVCEQEKTASHIRVNAIVPGYISTQMTKAFPRAWQEGARKLIPLQRFGFPEEVADAALFLATNEYANNCVLNLDGGLSAK